MNRFLFVAALGASTALATPAFAVDTYSSLGLWQVAVDSYVEDTTYGTNFADIADLSLDGGADVTFGSSVSIRTIGSGWGTWSGGYTGQVLYSNGASSLTGTFDTPVDAFGFFSESDPFGVYKFTLGLSDGSSVSGDFEGDSGAGFLGWVGGGITSFTISTADVGFAIGDFFIGTSAVPEPASWLTMIAGFGMVGAAMRRQKAKAVAA